jgi:hypothetical protein
LLVGIGLAFGVAAFARIVGFDRDRAFYPVVLIVVASFYVLFAVMAGAPLRHELAQFLLFAALAVAGFRTSLWIAAAGLILHGLFDFTRHAYLGGEGVPVWWPAFCGGYDIAAGMILAGIILVTERRPSARGP